jgi:hypothetical protein
MIQSQKYVCHLIKRRSDLQLIVFQYRILILSITYLSILSVSMQKLVNVALFFVLKIA